MDSKRNFAAQWSVYILRCDDDSLYCGISNDIHRRFVMHLEGKGAKYFRGRKPVALVHLETELTHSEAAKREYQIKQLSRAQKLLLLSCHQDIATILQSDS